MAAAPGAAFAAPDWIAATASTLQPPPSGLPDGTRRQHREALAAALPLSPPSLPAAPLRLGRQALDRLEVLAPGASSTSASAAIGAAGAALLALAGHRRRRGATRTRRGRGDSLLRLWVAGDLPPALVKTVGKGEIKKIISWTLDKKGREATVGLLENLKVLGFSWATKAGISLGVEDLCVPEEKGPICDGTRQRAAEAEHRYENGDITVAEKFVKVTGEWTRASEAVKNAALTNFKENMPTNPVYMMATSGARGNVSQVRQLIAMRGLMADANGELIEVPISNSLRDGMTVTDVLISSHGARKGVVDTALRTAESGYLYRRLDFAASHTVVRAHDCGTTKVTDQYMTSPFKPTAKFKDRIRGRTLGRDIIDPETGEVLFERGHLLTVTEAAQVADRWTELEKAGVKDLPPIGVRTPLTCQLKDGICSACYGEDLSTPGEVAALGCPVGVIAAQSMGEPGTQLTMRTFHTGGAFEGKGSKGVFATRAGHVRLTNEDGQPIVAEGMSEPAGRWIRMPTGEVACLLQHAAKIEVIADDEVIQSEELVADTLVKVQDGERVSRGQGLFELNAREMVEQIETAGDDANIQKLPKPIVSDESGEVIVTAASSSRTCLKEGSSLVWVLQGTPTTTDDEATLSLAVRRGDVVAPGMPLATEWAVTRRAGVQRFQPPASGAAAASASEPAAAGWRQLDWLPQEAQAADHEDAIEEGNAGEDEAEDEAHEESAEGQEAKAPEAVKQKELCIRTDFDWFCLDGALTEYRSSSTLPAALMPQGSTVRRFGRDRGANLRNQLAAEKVREDLTAVKPTTTPIYAFTPQAEAKAMAAGAAATSSGSADSGSMGVICSNPTGGAAGVICPVSRTANPEHIVPRGGLVFQLPRTAEDEGRPLLWVPEEAHTLKVTKAMLKDLVEDHGHFCPEGCTAPGLMQSDGLDSAVELSASGCFCTYLPNGRQEERAVGAPSAVVEMPDGRLRRESTDRISCSKLWDDIKVDHEERQVASEALECVVKPGFIFACPSEFLDETWYSESVCGRGVHFHQHVVPPGVPFVPGLSAMKSDSHWRVVEALDSPLDGPVVRMLVRLAQRVVVPDDPEPVHPAESRHLTSWHLPYTQGELVRSLEPVVLAYEVHSSLSRHPGELHCATPVPAPEELEGEGTRQAAPALPTPTLEAATPDISSLSLELVKDAPESTLCVVQHSPLGSPRPAGGGEEWTEPPPKYIAPPQDKRLSADKPTWLPTPRRQLASEGGGCVCRVDNEGGRSTVVLIGPRDISRVRCESRPTVGVGALVRMGEALSEEDTAPFSGQVLAVELASGMAYEVTLRRARAHLVTPGGEVRVRDNSIAEQGDLLGTENLVVPRTSDITQGLPRITRLFEASGKYLQGKLDDFFEEELKSHDNLEAALRAKGRLEEDLVSEIQSVYLEQGVFINSRHIETVVAQMCSKCEVTRGGGLVLKPGSLVRYTDVEAFVAVGSSTEVRVRPRVRGVTVVGKDLHPLVSMGFRECDNIAAEVIMNGPERFPMNGVKENLMMGKQIDAGTNCTASSLWHGDERSPDLNLDAVPEWSEGESLGELLGEYC